MAVFPPEVLAEICQHCKSDKDTLKALRLQNKFLAVEASQYLYKTLLVYQTPRSWEKLHFVSQCQHLTHHTEELEIATLEYLPVYADFEAWKLATSKTRLVAQRSLDILAGAAAIMRQADLYRSYSEWRNGEQELLNAMTESESDGDAVAFLIQDIGEITFTNLHTVKSLGAHELWPLTPHGSTNRRERETAVLESLKPDTRTCKRMSAHLCFALEVFRLGNPFCNNIVSLELHRYREILVEQTFNIPSLQTLENLTLSFPSGPEEEIEHQMWGPWKLARWLRNAQELKTLRILTQDLENSEYGVYRNVVRLFKDAAWPKLRIVHFKEIFMTSRYLLRFLRKHVNSLESLYIEEPIVKKDDWQRLAAKVRAMFSTTKCDLRLTDPHPEAENEYCLDDNDYNFVTTEFHPDFHDLHWEDRYPDLLADD